MSTVVYEPPQEHYCRPGVTIRISTGEGFGALPKGTRLLEPPSPWDYPAGTVVECDCGKTYVSRGSVYVNTPGMCYFRREGRFERWLRERRTARA